MKKIFSLLIVFALTFITAVVFAADPSVAVVAAPTFMAWVIGNENALLKTALAMTEVMALIPQFKGNGIVDSIIKCVKYLVDAQAKTADPAA